MHRLKDYLNNDQINELEKALRDCALGKPFTENIESELNKTIHNFLIKYKHKIPKNILDYWLVELMNWRVTFLEASNSKSF